MGPISGFVKQSLFPVTGMSWGKVLLGNIDSSYQGLESSVAKSQLLQTVYEKVLEIVRSGGGKKAVERHIKKKLLVQQRLNLLLDNEKDFFEISPLAGLNMDYGDIPKAGGIAGIGKVSGSYCMIFANDATVKGGTMFPIGVSKQLRCQAIAQQNRIPCIYLIDSGGAFLPLQADIFPDKNHGGRVFYNQAVMSSENIPQISIVCGSCTAGAAYIPTMSEETIIVDKVGTIFLAGPPLVKAATGEVISAEELGGATVHCKLSGCSDHFAVNEKDAFQTCRQIISGLNLKRQIHNTQDVIYPTMQNSQELIGVAYPPTFTREILYKILAHILDGSQFHEFKEKYGSKLIAGFGKIEGHFTGIMMNMGDIHEDDALKGCHFVQLCNQRGFPLIFLKTAIKEKTNLENQLDWWLTLKAKAKLLATISTAMIPKITLQLDHTETDNEDFTMGGRALDSTFVFAWPTVSDWSHDIDQMSNDLFVSDTSRIPTLTGSLFDACRLWNDGIVLPQDTRKVLGQILDIVLYYTKVEDDSQRIPVLRM